MSDPMSEERLSEIERDIAMEPRFSEYAVPVVLELIAEVRRLQAWLFIREHDEIRALVQDVLLNPGKHPEIEAVAARLSGRF